MTNNQIVIRIKKPSDYVRDLRERWLNDGGADLLITKEAKSVLEDLLGPFKDVADLIELIRSMGGTHSTPSTPSETGPETTRPV